MFASLTGYRTYIIAILIGIVAALQFLGMLDIDTVTLLYGLLGAGGAASVRSAIR